MSNFYENYVKLCKEKGVSPSKAAEENGINRSNVTVWKNKGYKPSYNALKRLANYFDCSVETLDGTDSQPNDEIEDMRDELFEKRKVLFDLSSRVRKEDIEVVTEIIRHFVD